MLLMGQLENLFMKTSQLQIRVSNEQKKLIRQEAESAGKDISAWVLEQVLPQKKVEFQSLISDISSATEKEQSFILASLNDFLTTLSPLEFQKALQLPNQLKLTPLLLNYITAMIEHTANLKEVAPPVWVNYITPLAEPFFSSTLSSLRIHLLLSSPVAFKRRNIFIDSTIGSRV